MKTKILLLSIICTSIISINAMAAQKEADSGGKKGKSAARGRLDSSASLARVSSIGKWSNVRDMGLKINTL